MKTDNLEKFEQLLKRYNQCFYDRNIESLRNMYVPDGEVIYFDNHANCDSCDLETHLSKVKDFFDSGIIVELLSEKLTVYQFGDAACMVVKVRYSNNPQPGVRASFFLEKYFWEWKIRHIHFSTDPNEVKT
ncbi:MAG: nuclear transport factor 2 family protein [Pleurocapsa sp. MO_226.B13]|nr:nuclear transport factor 2 family protein [Pleurocapsa sp. MO_226.B13]